MKITSIIILLILNISFCFSQKDSTKHIDDRDPFLNHTILSLGISSQHQLVGEIGIMYGKYIPMGCIIGGLYGWKLGTEFNFNFKRFFVAPKIGYEVNYALFCVRINIIDYYDFKYNDLKFTPEIGLSFASVFNICYGYNISLMDNRIPNIPANRFVLVCYFDRTLWQ